MFSELIELSLDQNSLVRRAKLSISQSIEALDLLERYIENNIDTAKGTERDIYRRYHKKLSQYKSQLSSFDLTDIH